MAAETGHLRIGELSRRSGVSNQLLRAWERRYGLLEPMRTEGGYRLYSDQDERRVAAMLANLDRGLSAAEAARLALDTAEGVDAPDATVLERGTQQLRATLDSLDEAGAHAALDRLLAELSVEAVLREAGCPTCASSGSAGRAATPRSARSTSRPGSCAAGCSASPADGGVARVRTRCSRARRTSITSSV